jgi:hypothetical protein
MGMPEEKANQITNIFDRTRERLFSKLAKNGMGEYA